MFPQFYTYRNIVRAKLYIDEHYTHNLTTERLCKEGCYSPYHFIRLFKELYGITPNQYIIKKRMERAKELLSQEMQVSDVCMQIGYESLQSFSRTFKSIIGTTPTQYQLQAQQQLRSMQQEPEKHIPSCFLKMIKE